MSRNRRNKSTLIWIIPVSLLSGAFDGGNLLLPSLHGVSSTGYAPRALASSPGISPSTPGIGRRRLPVERTLLKYKEQSDLLLAPEIDLSQLSKGESRPPTGSSSTPGTSVPAAVWQCADVLNFLVIGVLNAKAALDFHGAALGALHWSVALHVAATTFLNVLLGGTTLSSLLLCADPHGPRRVIWLGAAAYGWSSIGAIAAIALHKFGRFGCLQSPMWQLILLVNSTLLLISAVLHSGWFPADRAAPPQLLQWLGALLYTCGGSLWRDVFRTSLPGFLALANVVPLALGLSFCRFVHSSGNSSEAWTLSAGLPVITCLYAAFAI
eukprot:gb/GFBE01057871.1/.p1 GENE.gb/GFBE01057871.1/~~gb/GFBE01057871.1/.p1  ORF type:complete len:325 (+),score=46.64 gb/GFBE01057871.1/:1-975(+)